MNFNLRNISKSAGIWLTIICLSFTQNSCESFVAVDLPTTLLTGEAVFDDTPTADAAMAYIYAKMRSDVLVTGSLNGLSALLGIYADELDYYGLSNLETREFYQNNLLPTNGTVNTTWNNSYNLVYATNALIEGVIASDGMNQLDKERLLGEAYFIRAYLHFYLLNLYGAIPYVMSTDYKVNKSISKRTVSDCYALLSTDLLNAIALLPDSYINAGRTKPNRSAAYSLLARAKLYSGQWSQALIYSNLVIENTALYTWLDDINTVFLSDSLETIWQLSPQYAGNNTLEAQTFIFFSGPPPVFALRNDLVDSFEIGDLRRQYWIGTVTDGINNWYYPNKYKKNVDTGTTVEYSILFRLEEQYLIRAEAKTQLGDLEGGKADINKIRNRVGLSDTNAITKEEVLNSILNERRKEFFTESGHRWFDLKRTGNASVILESKKPGWDSKDLLWPLPENELLLNKNLLPQNEGY